MLYKFLLCDSQRKKLIHAYQRCGCVCTSAGHSCCNRDMFLDCGIDTVWNIIRSPNRVNRPVDKILFIEREVRQIRGKPNLSACILL